MVVFDQCIDDLINMERSATVSSARTAWLSFADMCGWDIPLAQSPAPSQLFRALGVFVDLRPLPLASALITACENRLLAIEASLVAVVCNNAWALVNPLRSRGHNFVVFRQIWESNDSLLL